MPEIRRDGGLQDPIIVRHDTGQVIEGNSRLAAYRKLSEDTSGDDSWARIPCLVVSKLTDNQQARLLAQTHLTGKTDWSPYAKALFCFRWVVEQKRDLSSLHALSGIRPAEINKDVSIIQFMRDNNDNKLSHFSYYNVLVRNRAISTAITEDTALKDILLPQIKAEAFTAQEMRQRLPTVIAKPRILRKFQNGDIHLEEAYDRAKISGAEQRLKKIRGDIDDIELEDLASLQYHEVKAIEQVVRHIGQGLRRVTKMVGAQLSKKSPSNKRQPSLT